MVEAEDGVQALKRLRNVEARPYLIVLDMMMPRMSGWDFCAERNRDERLRSIPLVVVSADPLAAPGRDAPRHPSSGASAD